MTSRLGLRPLSSLFLSFACQLVAFGADAFVFHSTVLPPWAMLSLHALFSFLLARFVGLSRPWQYFNLLLVPLLALSSASSLPSWLWAGIALLLVLVYFPTLWTRVPYYPTPLRMYEQIAEVLPADRDFTFIDLGCGFSGLLSYLAELRPRGRFYGMEISLLPFMLSYARSRFSKNKNLKIQFRNFWKDSLAAHDFVYAFLAPPPMAALWAKVKAEMKPGSVFITNTFPVDDKADLTRQVVDGRTFTLYFHRR